jgi:hypothetical protein
MADLPRMYNGDLMNTNDLNDLGYKITICGSTIWLIYQQVKDSFEELKATGAVDPSRFATRWDVASLLGLGEIYELERKYGVSDTVPTNV